MRNEANIQRGWMRGFRMSVYKKLEEVCTMGNSEKFLREEFMENRPIRCEKCGGKLFYAGSGTYTCEDCEHIMMDDFGLYERMSCFDNLKFYQMLDGRGTADIDDMLNKVGLLQAKKTQAMNLSKGMKNRLAFARAILRNPKILFLDEPTSGLDPNTVEEIHNMILEEKKRGTTIFLTTHNMHEAEKLCDNIALLNEGSIVEYGNPVEICRKYNHQKKFVLHLKNGNDIELEHGKESADEIKMYIENDELETIHTTEPNLEKIFMELTGKGLNK